MRDVSGKLAVLHRRIYTNWLPYVGSVMEMI